MDFKTLLYSVLGLFIVFFTGNSSQGSVKPFEENVDGCDKEYECIIISNCYSDVFPDTIFPCNSENGGDIRVCCPLNMTRTTTTTVKTTITTSRTPATTTRIPQTSIWANLSRPLREKAKLLPSNCGKIVLGDRIYNGMATEIGQFPWMALLGYNINGSIQYFCGGTLINKRYILTAAHCTNVYNSPPVVVRLGEWDVTTDKDCQEVIKEQVCSPDPIDYRIQQVIVHERFGDRSLPSYQNDIALLRMAQNVDFTEFISPLCLTPDIFNSSKSRFIISGWGVSEYASVKPTPILQYAELPLYDFNECNSIAYPQNRPLANTQFCAGGDNSSSCHGDSGGPLFFLPENANKYYLKGITSLATSVDCGDEGKPVIYTEVAAYIEWILNKIRK